jgi:hypothetical protein
MAIINYKIEAFWDEEVQVWVATSEDISGLVTEAENIDILTKKIRNIIPELLILNGVINPNDNNEITWELITHHQELMKIAC